MLAKASYFILDINLDGRTVPPRRGGQGGRRGADGGWRVASERDVLHQGGEERVQAVSGDQGDSR